MRTLSRPMFNMGGPIKQGIMDGIREPYKHGGQAALVGNPVYPKTGGREHHFAAAAIPPILAAMGRFAARPFAKHVMKQVPKLTKIKWRPPVTGHQRGYTGTAKAGGWEKGKEILGPQKVWEPTALGRWFKKDPLYKTVAGGTSWAGKGIRKAGSLAKGAVTTPTGLATTGSLAYMFWPDGTPKTPTELIEDNVIRKGDKDYGPHTKGGPTITQEMRDAKAKADKEKRINDLLDTMGYDKARKNAAYDALIDAGRMVSERGTLDPKNIGRELIDPIVASASQRFDKPEQIREAVGLMQVKADIQKEMEDPQVKALRALEIEKGEKALAGATLEETAEAFFAKHGQWPSGELLGNLARNKDIDITEVVDTSTTATGLKDIGDPVEFMEGRIKKFKEKGIEIPPGNYVVEDAIIIIDSEGNVSRR